MYNFGCETCSHIDEHLAPIGTQTFPCSCGGTAIRVWVQGRANGVIDDSIPGGLEIKNGLCHSDGTPKRFDSKSEIAREAKKRGLTNYVEHKGSKGSDKSKHTSRWV